MKGVGNERFLIKGNGDLTPNQNLFIASQVITSIFNAIITGVFMTGFLLYSRVSVANVGIVMTIPVIQRTAANHFKAMALAWES